MTTNDTPNPILEAARQLQEQKMAGVQRLVDTRTRIAEVRRLMNEAEIEDAAAYQKALRAGWSEAELKQVGIDPPVRRAAGRPRGRGRGQGGSGNALVDSQLQREAGASTRLDGETPSTLGSGG